MAALILDTVIAVLLVVTIVYCWRLNRRLVALRSGREELARLIASLGTATGKAEAAITGLKDNAKGTSDELRREISSARALRDELALITESGNNLANRLENRLINAGRPANEGAVDLAAFGAGRTGRDRPSDDGGAADADKTARNELLKSLKQAR